MSTVILPISLLPFDPATSRTRGGEHGQVIYDPEATLVQTLQALERLVGEGRCKAIGLSDVTLEKVQEIVAAARIKPAVVQVESHPDLLNGNFWNSARSMGLYYWHFQRWDTAWTRKCWMIL